jgi:hypothetical protein
VAPIPRWLLPTHNRASLVGSGLLVQASTFPLMPAGSGLVVRSLVGEGFVCPFATIHYSDDGTSE